MDARHGTDIEKTTASTWLVDIAEELDGSFADIDRTPEVNIEHCASSGFFGAFDFADDTVAGVVHVDVDSVVQAKVNNGGANGGLLVVSPDFVQPVVRDSEGGSELGKVKEVLRVPIIRGSSERSRALVASVLKRRHQRNIHDKSMRIV